MEALSTATNSILLSQVLLTPAAPNVVLLPDRRVGDGRTELMVFARQHLGFQVRQTRRVPRRRRGFSHGLPLGL